MVSSFYQNETKERFAIDHYVFHSFRFGICWICSPNFRGEHMKEQLHLKNHLKEVRTAAKLALILCIALDKKFEELFYF